MTNHRTGDKCILTFKPRGWRGKDACEIKGRVTDASGNTTWNIAGRWSTQLVARRTASGGDADIDPDAQASAAEIVLLWRNSDKPPNQPFNLTPFAMSLNGITPELEPWLAPTDCRLRPDQHAFESGQFEKANTLKTQLEDHQRVTRRKRDTGELPPHKPRWFSREVDADTNEGFWRPQMLPDHRLEYWVERERVGRAHLRGEKAEWRDVDPIYGASALSPAIGLMRQATS